MEGTSPRFMKVEMGSNLVLKHSKFTNMEVSIINCFSSDMEIELVTAKNITSSNYITDSYFCTDLIMKNFELKSCTATDTISVISMRETLVNTIEDCTFYDNQPLIFNFLHSQFNKFERNSFDGMNKAIRAIKQTVGNIKDSSFVGMVQNVKSGDIYQSNIISDGSAIGKTYTITYRNFELKYHSN
jgi:hypothetical protein